VRVGWAGGGSKGIGVRGVDLEGAGEGGDVRVRRAEGRRTSSMPSLMGFWGLYGSSGEASSSSFSSSCWDPEVSYSSGWVMTFSRAKRMGEASRAFWAAAESRKMASAMLSAGLWYSYCMIC